MTKANRLISEDVQFAIKIIDNILKEYTPKIYIFGSRANNTCRLHSDIDIAVSSIRSIPDAKLSEVREYLEQSNIIYTVDLLDLAKIDTAFKEKIIQQGILWND